MVSYSLVAPFVFFLDFYVTPAFSILTSLDYVLSWPSCLKHWSVDLEVRAIQVRAPSEIFCFIFDDFRRIKLLLFVGDDFRRYNYFYSSEFPTNNDDLINIPLDHIKDLPDLCNYVPKENEE